MINHRFFTVNQFLKKYPRLSFVAGSLLCLGLGFVDLLTGYELNFSIFYLIPILWAAWILGNPAGYCLAILCVFIWGIADKLAGHEFSADIIFVWNTLIRLAFFMISAYFANALSKAIKREGELARHDFMTGVYNTKAFYELLEVESHRCRRYNRPLTVVYIDCDDFKAVNDRLGHHKGDELLKLTAEMIKKELRLTDVCARLGGDEFAVILPETHNRDAKNIFLRIRKSLADTMSLKDYSVTYSIGVATFLNPPVKIDDMITKADALMYDVKKTGKNMVNAEVIGSSNSDIIKS